MERAAKFRKRLRNGINPATTLEALEPRTLFSFTFTSIYAFTGKNSGILPDSLVMDAGGNLFGVTSRGGAKKYGTIFEIPATSNTAITLASFTGTNGLYPAGNIVLDSNGVLWGTTAGGGASNRGTIFSFPTGSTTSGITTVYTFNGTNGSYPETGLITDTAGNFYGTTYGSTHGKNASILFTLTSDGSTLTRLATFSGKDLPDGGLIVDSGGNIFGTTSRGGSKKDGSVFKFPAGSTASTVQTLASFTGSNGVVPSGDLLFDSNGNIVGTTGGGGSHGDGTLFRFNVTANTITTLANFRGNNGIRPVGNLVTDASGNYFGVTALGGAHGRGAVFEYVAGNTTSSVIAIFSFNSEKKGRNPSGPLIIDANGNLFGATYQGGIDNRGTVFELASGGSAVPSSLVASSLGEARLEIVRQPSDVQAGRPFSLLVRLTDALGNLLPSASPITLSIASGPSGKLKGLLALSPTSGVAAFEGLTLSTKGRYTLKISMGTLAILTAEIVIS